MEWGRWVIGNCTRWVTMGLWRVPRSLLGRYSHPPPRRVYDLLESLFHYRSGLLFVWGILSRSRRVRLGDVGFVTRGA